MARNPLTNQLVLTHYSHYNPKDRPGKPLASGGGRVRDDVLNDPYRILISQNRPLNYDANLDGKYGQALGVRSGDPKDRKYIVGGVIKEGKHAGRPNMTLRGEVIANRAIQKWDEAVKMGRPLRMLMIDEATNNTHNEVAEAVAIIQKRRPVAAKHLGFYVTAGEDADPTTFNPALVDFWRKNKSALFGEVYGGMAGDGRGQVHAALQGGAIKRMQAAGLRAYPMLSAAPRNIGTGPQAVKEMVYRFKTILKSTGMIPSIWHMGKVGVPLPKGFASTYGRLVMKARRGELS